MWKLNLKIAWRNLLKHKGYALINIFGLALGLAGFIFMILFINHEKSYDTWNKQLKNVYQMQEYSDYSSIDKKAHWRNEIDLRLSKALTENIPQVKAVTMINTDRSKNGVTLAGKASFLQSGLRMSDSLFFKVFPFTFKYGSSETAFSKPYSIVLKDYLAIKYFGQINPIGKSITIAGGPWKGSETTYTVTGVVETPATPTVVGFDGVYFASSKSFNINDDYGHPAEVYVQTEGVKDLDQLNSIIQKYYLPIKRVYAKNDGRFINTTFDKGNEPVLKIVQLGNVHQFPLEGKSWREQLQPVLLLSLLLLVVSIINFINLATAQAAGRAKEIGVKKVVGAYRRSIIFQFLTETFIQCVVAMFTALLLIEICLPTLNTFFAMDLSLFNSPASLFLLLQLFAIVLIVAFLTGLYPSVFLSSYKPQEVLKGNFYNGKNGSVVRKVLVGAQFVVSVSFIIGILVVNYQLKYLKERDNGFTATGLINVRTHIAATGWGRSDYIRLKNVDGVKNVAYSSAVIGDNWTMAQTFKYKGESVEMYGTAIGIEGMQALDARLLAGRLFSPDVINDTVNNAILNETAAKLFSKNMVGQTIMAMDTTPVNIIGVIKDVQVEGFEKTIKPALYVVETEKWKNGVMTTHKQTTLIRFEKSKIKNVLAELEKIYAEKNQFYPISYSFVEEDFAAVLAEHERFEKMVAVFSFLSLALSLFGLFSLAAFITKQRTKEIAVRKVLGAENTDILVLLNKGYIWIILIANAIAFPLTYILINKWLSAFAYRITISATPFVVAFFASVVITIITVSLQAKKAVNANPVKALKYE